MLAIYCRESTEKQEIDTLVSLCIKEAKKLGFKEYEVYKDVESGYSNTRSEYLRMLEDIKKGYIDTLIVYESSRLTRDELEHQLVFKLFREKGVKIYTINHGWLDLNNEDDIFLSSLLNLLDAREGRKTATRVRDRMKELCQNGEWTGGPAPLGYKLVNKKLIIDVNEAQTVKNIFHLFLEGNSRERIARLYNFERKRVFRLLVNPIYIGKLKFHSVKKVNKKVVENKEYTTYKGNHQPIIDEETFYAVQRKISNIKREVNSEVYIFKDLLYCTCGNKLYYKINSGLYKGKKYPFEAYYCSANSSSCLKKAIKENELLDEVFASLESIINDFDFSEETENTEILSKINFYQKQREQCKKKTEILTRNLLNDFITQEVFEKLISENKENEAFCTEKIETLENIIKQSKAKQNNSKIIKEYFKKIKKEKNPEKLNKFLKVIIDKIEFVNEFRIYLHLRL